MRRNGKQGWKVLAGMVLAVALGVQAQETVRIGEGSDQFLQTYAAGSLVLPEGSTVLEVGSNHRRVRLGATAGSYVELADGLNFWDPKSGSWRESVEKFEIYEDAFVADKGRSKAILKRRLTGAGDGVDVLAPDGERLVSEVIGLVLYDRAADKAVLIAELRETEGVLLPPNQVVYPDAFTGDVSASLRYTWRKGSFEQDVILRSGLPEGWEEAWGIDPESAEIQVWTGFSPSREPVKTARHTYDVPPEFQDRFTPTDVVDEELDFGTLKIGTGKAFALTDEQGEPRSREVSTAKTWLPLEGDPGRRVLIESVAYVAIEPDLAALPRPQADAAQPRATGRDRLFASVSSRDYRRVADAGRWGDNLGAKAAPEKAAVTASADLVSRPGYVLDYVVNLTTVTNSVYTFRGDVTHYLSGPFTVTGTVTFEGGAVLKLDYDAYVKIGSSCSVVCKTAMYRPVTFTCEGDHTIGLRINETGTYYQKGIVFEGTGSHTFEHFRFRYADIVFAPQAASWTTTAVTLRHGQIVNCGQRVFEPSGYAGIYLQNVLVDHFYELADEDPSYLTWINLQNVTLHDATYRIADDDLYSFSSRNGLFSDVNYGDAGTKTISSGSNNETDFDPGDFVAAGAGNFYLENDSEHLDAGTTFAVSTIMLADLKKRTTQAPNVLGGSTSLILSDNTTSWGPVVPRDNDSCPDLGYHYPPIDYAVENVYVGDGSKLVVGAGTAIAAYGEFGLLLDQNSFVSFHGTTTDRIKISRYESVQEEPTRWGGGSTSTNTTYHAIYPDGTSSASKTARFMFTDFCMADDMYQIGLYSEDSSAGHISVLDVTDCRFYNGWTRIRGGDAGGSSDKHTVRNNLFLRGDVEFAGEAELLLQNTLFKGMDVGFDQDAAAASWFVRYNALDDVTLTVDDFDGSQQQVNRNGYLNGSDTITGSTFDVTPGGTFSYEDGPFGEFYHQSGGLLGGASPQTASGNALAQYTVETGTGADTGSLDIGFHYVAVDGGDDPVDSDSDGIDDYIEDHDGDGNLDEEFDPLGWDDSLNVVDLDERQTPWPFWTDTQVTKEQIAEYLAGSVGTITDVTLVNTSNSVSVSENVQARGLYGRGAAVGLPEEFDFGILLSSGRIAHAMGLNHFYDDAGLTADLDSDWNLDGDDDLDAALQPLDSEPELSDNDITHNTLDVAALAFTLAPNANGTLQFDYIFASEEYPFFLDPTNLFRDDGLAIFVNHTNRAFFSNTNNPVSVYTVNTNRNAAYYRDNLDGTNATYRLPWNGFTSTTNHLWMTTESVAVTTNDSVTIKIVIGDEDDGLLDSVILLRPLLSLE